MSIDASVNDFLTGGGGKSAKFENIGDKIKGTVVSAEKRQQTELNGSPKFWDDGNPMEQLVITLQTDDSDAADPDDDGKRNLYVKGSKKPESKSGTAALISAMKKAGASLEVGGTLIVQYVGDGTPSQRGFDPPKQFAMAYKAPSLDTGDLLADTSTPMVPPTPAAPAPAPQVSEEDLFAEL